MNIEKAIRDLKARIDGELNIEGVDECKDMKLGIEALMWRKHQEEASTHFKFTPLPGQTED